MSDQDALRLVIGAEIAQLLELCARRARRDHPRARGLGHLQREDRDAACALRQHDIASLVTKGVVNFFKEINIQNSQAWIVFSLLIKLF